MYARKKLRLHHSSLQFNPQSFKIAKLSQSTTSTSTASSSPGISTPIAKPASPAAEPDLSVHFQRLLDSNSVSSWNSIISDLARNGDPIESLRLFRSMLAKSLRPDRSSIPCAVKACAALRESRSGRQLHLQALVSGLQPDLFVSSSLVDMYAKCGELRDARKVFDETPDRNLVNWTSMIVGYTSSGAADEALRVFKEFLSDGGCGEIDPVMAVAAISVCSRLAEGRVTRGVHGFVEKMGFGVDVSVRNTLIDAYAKCGDLGISREMFDGMELRDCVSWNTILAKLAHNGSSMAALRLFVKMAEKGFPVCSAVMLPTVMSMCAHSGIFRTCFRCGW